MNGLGNYLNRIDGSLAQVEASRKCGCDGTAIFRLTVNNNEKKTYTELLTALEKGPFAKVANVPRMPWLDKPQSGMLRGFVYSASSASPADGAEVSLVGTTHRVYTDGSGYYAFVGVKPGDYLISVKYKKGLHTEAKRVKIKRERVSRRDIILP